MRRLLGRKVNKMVNKAVNKAKAGAGERRRERDSSFFYNAGIHDMIDRER